MGLTASSTTQSEVRAVPGRAAQGTSRLRADADCEIVVRLGSCVPSY